MEIEMVGIYGINHRNK